MGRGDATCGTRGRDMWDAGTRHRDVSIISENFARNAFYIYKENLAES